MNILYLSQRVPEPPNKGDKIRSHHLARRLARNHAVHLGFLLDEAAEEEFAVETTRWAASSRWALRNGLSSAFHGAASALRGRPITSGWFHSGRLAHDVSERMRTTHFDVAVAYCSSMAEYLDRFGGPRVVDLVDVDSEKWGQYASRATMPRRGVYALEQRLLRRYERRLVDRFDRVVVISAAEKRILDHEGDARKTTVVSNGVDVEQWSPANSSTERSGLVFVGALDYFANVDGICHFARAVFPSIRARVPDTRLEIVGRRPASAVRALAEIDGVDVVGEVDDVRPFVWKAAVCVVPLRIAQGLQNKVLEAMAARAPVVATPAALRGFDGLELGRALVAGSDDQFVENVVRLLRYPDERERLASSGYALVQAEFSWDRAAREFETVLEEAVASHTNAAYERKPKKGGS